MNHGSSTKKNASFRDIANRISTGFLYLGMGWVLVMMFLTTFDVAGRFFFSSPVSGSIELSEYMLALFGICGLAYTHKQNGNVRVTLLTDKLSGKLSALLGAVTNILTLCVVLVLVWQGFLTGIEEYQMGTTTDNISIPVFIIPFLLSLGSLSLALDIMIKTYDSIKICFRTRYAAGLKEMAMDAGLIPARQPNRVVLTQEPSALLFMEHAVIEQTKRGFNKPTPAH